MDKRQAETEALLLEYEKQCLKDLQKAYTEALADVKKKLKALGDREPIQSVVYQVQFQEMLQEQLKTALDSLKNGSIESVRDFLNKTYEDSYLGTIYSIQGQGIPVYLGMDHEQVARTVNRKTDSLQFSQRLYDNVDKLGIAYKSQMSRGIANGSSYSKIAKQLALESEANYNQAMRIVRTEGGRVKSEAKLDSMKGAKKQGADIVKQWDATFDSKTRAEHRYLDGQIREIDEPFTDSQGRTAQAPHKFGIASMDVNCRCIVVERARWAIEGEEMPAKMDNTTGELVEADNYKEWKEKYQRKQAEKKPAPSKAKVFDKNSKTLPSVGDLFMDTNGELIKIVEVSDFEGIKSVTLENGKTVVLSNLSAIEKPKEYSEQYKELKKEFEANEVEHRQIKQIAKPFVENEIIERVGGGDLTSGSCSSLAFAYAGNKAGYDVLDFRDGNSCRMFSRTTNIKAVAELPNVKSEIVREFNDFTACSKLIKTMETNKEYYFTTGKHAAIIRKNDSIIEYLELQSATDNGFKRLTTTVLKQRFGAQKSHTVAGRKMETTSLLIDIESLGQSEDFKDLLGYLNTAVESQKKGASGYEK